MKQDKKSSFYATEREFFWCFFQTTNQKVLWKSLIKIGKLKIVAENLHLNLTKAYKST